MSKKYLALIMAVIMVLAIGLTGCGKLEDLTTSSVTVNDDGSIKAVIMESFDKSYYNENELVSMIDAEVNEYNASHGNGKISFDGHSLNNGVMTVELTFADVITYNNYMPNQIYVGTIDGAVSAGYDLNRSLVVAGKDGKTIGKEDLASMGAKKVIIVNEAVAVRAPGKMTHYSQGMEKIDSNTASASVIGCYFVIYK